MKQNKLEELYEIEKEYYVKLPHETRECNYIGLRYKDTLHELKKESSLTYSRESMSKLKNGMATKK